jgi:DNA primase
VLDEAIKLAEHDHVAGKAKVLMQVAPLLKAVRNPTTLAMYVDRLADSLAIDPKLVWRHIKEQASSAPGPSRYGEGPPREPAPRPSPTAGAGPGGQQASGSALDPVIATLLALIGDHPRLLGQLSAEVLDRLSDQGVADLLREAQDLCALGESVTGHRLIEMAPPEVRGAVASAVLAGTFSTSERPEQALDEIGIKIRARFAQRELDDLNRALARAYQAGDKERIQELLLRMQELRLLKAGQIGPQVH